MCTPEPYRLTFLLPPALSLLAPAGRHQPCLFGCVLEVTRMGQVEISGRCREAVFDQATRFLRTLIKDRRLPPMAIAATLRTPGEGEDRRPIGRRGGRDGWTIIIGADIAFSPSAIEPHLPAPQARAEDVGAG